MSPGQRSAQSQPAHKRERAYLPQGPSYATPQAPRGGAIRAQTLQPKVCGQERIGGTLQGIDALLRESRKPKQKKARLRGPIGMQQNSCRRRYERDTLGD